MATTESMPNASAADLSLATLPIELQLEVVSHLTFLERQSLKTVNQHFFNLIATPKPAEILEAENDEDVRALGLLYCNPCNKLLPAYRFSTKMQRRSAQGNKGGAHTRFCLNCGCRPLAGNADDLFKYLRGNQWEHNDVCYVRCFRCSQGRQNGWRCGLCVICTPIEIAEEDAREAKNKKGQLEWDARAEERRLLKEKDDRDLEEMHHKEREEDERRSARGEEPLVRRQLFYMSGHVRESTRWIETMSQGRSPQSLGKLPSLDTPHFWCGVGNEGVFNHD